MGKFPVFGFKGIVYYHRKAFGKGPGNIVGRKGSVGEVMFSEAYFWPIDTTYYVEVKKGNDINFWFYFLKTLRLTQRNTHSAVPGLNRNDVYEIEKKIPSYSEQEAIARILSDLDSKIELNIQMNKTLEAIGQALFKHWFVDFEFPNNEGRPYMSGGGEMVESELGEVPKRWQIACLGDFADILNGFAFKSEDYVLDGVFLLRTKNFSKEGYTSKSGEIVFLPTGFYNKYEKYRLRKFDMLLVMVGASVGRMAMVQSDILPALQNQNMWNFRAKNNKYQLYLNYLLRRIVKQNICSASGSARDFFRKDYFRTIKVFVPGVNMLERFCDKIAPLLGRIDSSLSEVNRLLQIRDSLLPRLMSGRIRTKKGEI